MKKTRFFSLICAVILLHITPVFPAYAAQDDSVIRLLLTKVEVTDQINVSLDGSYSIDHTVFQRGTALKIAVLDEGLFVYHGGMAMFCGQSVILTRHALGLSYSGLENGLRFNGAYALYPGDLHVTVQNGTLRLILYIPMEEYLWGVVPYEMSDSWPQEALKAQAIAARTYALCKKRGSASDYDLVDNTNDQAFYGIQSENVNALRAITETSGMIGIDAKGSPAQCYYSASNGGLTETLADVWSMENVPYLIRQEDPYDLENPGSTVRSYILNKDLSTGGPLERTLLEKAASVLRESGTQADISQEDLESVADVSLSSSRDVLLLTVMINTMQVPEEEEVYFGVQTGAETEQQPVKTRIPVRIVYSLFPEIESLCDLDINRGLSNEQISVRETDSSFVIEARRFGHGVGMSQRGAQWMAEQYQKTYSEILAFYYPGLRFSRVSMSALPTPSAVSDHFLVTPGPPATPTPRPTLMPIAQSEAEGLYIVSVQNISANSYLNLRSEPGMNGIVLRQLYYGQRLVVLDEPGDGWLHVKTDSCEGYVMQSFVTGEGTPAPTP